MASACSQKVTVCFTSSSSVDRFPVRWNSRKARIWKSLTRNGGCRKNGPYRRNQTVIRFAWRNGIRSFRPIKQHLAGNQFLSIRRNEASCRPPPPLDTDFIYAGIKAFWSWQERCLHVNVNGDSVKIWCVPSATHLPCILGCQNKFYGIIFKLPCICPGFVTS